MCESSSKRNPFALFLEHFGHDVDKFVDELRAFLGRQRFPVVLDSHDHLADRFGQAFAHVLYEIGPHELDRIEIVTARRRFHPVDARRLEELLR